MSEESKVVEAKDVLPEDQQVYLSKALFPDTHKGAVTLLGEERTLSPLVIKVARQLHTALFEVSRAIQKNADPESQNLDLDDQLTAGLLKAAEILAIHYGWDDVKTAIVNEEITIEAIQTLLNEQVALQNANDFLLTPLRVSVAAMKLAEIGTIQFLSLFSGLSSSNSTVAVSTS